MIKVYFYHGRYSKKKLPASHMPGNLLSLLFPDPVPLDHKLFMMERYSLWCSTSFKNTSYFLS